MQEWRLTSRRVRLLAGAGLWQWWYDHAHQHLALQLWTLRGYLALGGVPSPSVAMLPGLATGALGLLLGMRFFLAMKTMLVSA